MISVVIPTLNVERTLTATLAALVSAAVDGVVREVIVVDGGSQDATAAIADGAGARVIDAPGPRGGQLNRGAKAARSPWLLFLHADTVLARNWTTEAVEFIRDIELGHRPDAAAAFRRHSNERGMKARLLEAGARARSSILALPYGDQGLLISKNLFDSVGGYRDLPAMEDVDLVRRIGRRRLQLFETPAMKTIDRFAESGRLSRSLRNQLCVAMVGAGLPTTAIVRMYGRAKS